jgi:hypothetical protein
MGKTLEFCNLHRHGPADWILHVRIVVRSWDGKRSQGLPNPFKSHTKKFRTIGASNGSSETAVSEDVPCLEMHEKPLQTLVERFGHSMTTPRSSIRLFRLIAV